MIVYYHANKTHSHKIGFELGLVLRVRVFGTRKWPTNKPESVRLLPVMLPKPINACNKFLLY